MDLAKFSRRRFLKIWELWNALNVEVRTAGKLSRKRPKTGPVGPSSQGFSLTPNWMVTKLQHGGRITSNVTCNSNRIYFVMYGGPRRPGFSPFQGRSRAPSSNFRPRFESPGFPPPGHNVYPPLRQPFQPSQRPYGFMDGPVPQGVRPGFRPGAWQVAGTRQGFPSRGYPEQQRPHRVHTV